jgi:hypothetical protein
VILNIHIPCSSKISLGERNHDERFRIPKAPYTDIVNVQQRSIGAAKGRRP